MSYTLRGRTVAYDNISRGNATGRENIASASAPTTELVGGGYNTGASAKFFSNIAQGDHTEPSVDASNQQQGVVTIANENVAQGG